MQFEENLRESVTYIFLLIERINWIIGEPVSRLTKRGNAARFVPVCGVNRVRNDSRHWHNRIAISTQVDVSRTKRGARASAKSVSVARSGKDDLRTRTLNSSHIGDPQEISGIGSCLYERRTHTFDRDGKTCSGAMAQLGTFEGITREKGYSVSLSRATTLFPLSSLSPFCSFSSIALGWSVSLLHGRMATENTRRRGQRAQTERISPLVRDLQNLSLRATRFASRWNRSAMKTRTICEYQLHTITISTFFCGSTRCMFESQYAILFIDVELKTWHTFYFSFHRSVDVTVFNNKIKYLIKNK